MSLIGSFFSGEQQPGTQVAPEVADLAHSRIQIFENGAANVVFAARAISGNFAGTVLANAEQLSVEPHIAQPVMHTTVEAPADNVTHLDDHRTRTESVAIDAARPVATEVESPEIVQQSGSDDTVVAFPGSTTTLSAEELLLDESGNEEAARRKVFAALQGQVSQTNIEDEERAA